MFLMGLALFICSLVLLYIWQSQRNYNKQYGKPKIRSPPKVPYWALPFIGHLAYLGSRPDKNLMEWGKLYGSLFIVKFGNLT